MSIKELEEKLENHFDGLTNDEESTYGVVKKNNQNLEMITGVLFEGVKSYDKNTELKHERELKSMSLDQKRFSHGFWLLVGILIFIVTLIFGLIFVKDDSDTALKILTHILAAGMGIVTGIGWKNR
ncbi:hypothetical protein AWH60_09200 [Pseudoalteromonas haloplanktis]|nr:hypothetical protein AWH60_09200 [Pseudoalteromonas haloplanktis]